MPEPGPEDVYRELYASAPDAILLVDQDGTILLANPAAETLLGLPPDQLVGRVVEEFVPESVRARHGGHRKTFAEHPRPRPMGSGLQLSAQHPDGTLVPVEISLSPVEAEGKQLVLAIIRDVTRRRTAEQTIQDLSRSLTQRVAHLEVLNSELESFSYSVSHDLRAPLRAIDGFSLALLEDYGELLPTEGKHYLDRVRAGAQRMAELIDDLLVLSRISRAELEVADVDVSDLAGVVMRALTARDPDRRAEVDIEPGLTMRADPRLLRLVLENLLGNAWKFTGNEPWTHVEVRAAELDGQPAVLVRDNGTGFDEQYAGRMFGAFQRLHLDTEFPGTGIGLAIVQRILVRHGGAIVASARPGEGATFTFRTTAAAPDVEQAPKGAGR